jgi:dipeptidyl aminopeptidase/acylaminoacyl peptidase
MRRWLSAVLVLCGASLQAAVISPGDTLVTDGIPPIPQEIVEDVGRYSEMRAASFLSWHPTRCEMLISTRFADTAQVHEVRSPLGARRQLTFFSERIGGAVYPRRSGEFFVFRRDTGGDEFFQLYRYDRATGAVTALTSGRAQNDLGVFSNFGDRLAYGSTRRNGADRDIYVVDPRDPKTERLVMEVQGGGFRVADWSPEDKQLLVIERLSISESRLWLVDVVSGVRREITPKGGPAAYDKVVFSRDGTRLYLTTDRDSEFLRLASLDLATGRVSVLTSLIPWDIDDFEVSPDGRLIAVAANEDGTSVLRLMDSASGKWRPRVELPMGVVRNLGWHQDSRYLAITLAEARATQDVHVLDVTTRKVERWTESEAGGLITPIVSAPRSVGFPGFDGRMISAFVYRPPEAFKGPRPVVVSIHGGPEGQSRSDQLMRQSRWAYLVNELGIAVIMPNVRGSTGYGKSFLALDDGERREDSVKDIGTVLDWIATRSDLDSSRVLVTGGSYGGYMTLAVAARYSDRVRCAVDVVGISNFVTFLERTEAYRRDLRRVEYGDERDPKMRALLESISPVNHVADMKKPLFIVQGQNDPRVPVGESEQMVAALKKNGTPVWYLKALDEGHGFAKKRNVDFQFYAFVAFIREHLLR